MKFLLVALLVIVPLALGLQSFNQHDSQASIQADSVCFTRDVLPIINSNCAMAKCHDAITHSEGFNLTTYQGVMKGIKAGSPSTSSIYREINSNAMPQSPFNKLSDTMKSIIRLWIQQGAKNSTCAPINCDTLNVNYDTHIKPLVTKNCLGCHSGGQPEGGVNLSDDITVDALKEKILCCVTHGSGCKPMPPNNINLNICELGQVRNWVLGTSTTNVNADAAQIPELSIFTLGNDAVRIRYRVENSQPVTLSFYSYSGRELRRIDEGVVSIGEHEVSLSTASLPSGVYFVRVQAGRAIRSAMLVH